jgi:hypothetical protein
MQCSDGANDEDTLCDHDKVPVLHAKKIDLISRRNVRHTSRTPIPQDKVPYPSIDIHDRIAIKADVVLSVCLYF